MTIYFSHSGASNYTDDLYEPLKNRFGAQHAIFFPHDPQNVDVQTKDIITRVDLVLADASKQSTGQGIELGWANAAGVPIVAIYAQGSAPSASLRFIDVQPVEYQDIEDMLEKISWLLHAK